jgi:hypothetical protein
VAQHEQIGILGQIRPDQHRQQAEQAPHQAVDERQQHLEMVPATLLIPQQNPSSQHETEFPTGTPYDVPVAIYRRVGIALAITGSLLSRKR